MNTAKILECISPIDGSVYATRQTLSLEEALSKLDSARDAQRSWQAHSYGS